MSEYGSTTLAMLSLIDGVGNPFFLCLLVLVYRLHIFLGVGILKNILILFPNLS